MSKVKKEMKAEVRELKQMALSGKTTLGSQHTRNACIKATNTDIGPPKKKHVLYLLDYIRTGENPQKVIDILVDRTKEKNWVVAFKALCVFHSLMRDGDRRFMSLLASRKTNFAHMHNFLDRLSNEGFSMSKFIRLYANYLEEKVATFRELHFDFVREAPYSNEAFRSMGTDKLFDAIKQIQNQVDVLLAADMRLEDMTNGTIKFAYLLLLRDCTRLYVAVNAGLIIVLEKYFSMPLSEAELGFSLYAKFTRETAAMIQFLDVGRKIDTSSRSDIPELKQPPAKLLTALKNYIDGLKGRKVSVNPADVDLSALRLAGPKPTEIARNVVAGAPSDSNQLFSARAMTSSTSSTSNKGYDLANEINLLALDDHDIFDIAAGKPPAAASQLFSTSNSQTPSTPKPNASPLDIFDPLAGAGSAIQQPNADPMRQFPSHGQSPAAAAPPPHSFYNLSQPTNPWGSSPAGISPVSSGQGAGFGYTSSLGSVPSFTMNGGAPAYGGASFGAGSPATPYSANAASPFGMQQAQAYSNPYQSQPVMPAPSAYNYQISNYPGQPSMYSSMSASSNAGFGTTAHPAQSGGSPTAASSSTNPFADDSNAGSSVPPTSGAFASTNPFL